MSNVFYLDKVKIKKSFSAASVTYDRVAQLQRSTGRALLNSIDVKNCRGLVLDLGCGTGFLTAELLEAASQTNLKAIVAMDIAMPMLYQARSKLTRHRKVYYLCGDAEKLPFVEKSADCVISNLALQWCGNSEAFFASIRRILKPGGQLFFSTFGPQTLWELKNAWAQADDFHHVNEFYSHEQLQHFLHRAGFGAIQISANTCRQYYNSVLELMQELKFLGAHNIAAGRNRNLTGKKQLQTMVNAYEKYRSESRVPATFETLLVSARV